MAAAANQLYFDGVKKGIAFGSHWNQLECSLREFKVSVKLFEEDLLDPLATRLGPQLEKLAQQMKIEFEELDDLMDDREGLHRETEFESILYKFSVFKKTFKQIKQSHNKRLERVVIKAKRHNSGISPSSSSQPSTCLKNLFKQ